MSQNFNHERFVSQIQSGVSNAFGEGMGVQSNKTLNAKLTVTHRPGDFTITVNGSEQMVESTVGTLRLLPTHVQALVVIAGENLQKAGLGWNSLIRVNKAGKLTLDGNTIKKCGLSNAQTKLIRPYALRFAKAEYAGAVKVNNLVGKNTKGTNIVKLSQFQDVDELIPRFVAEAAEDNAKELAAKQEKKANQAPKVKLTPEQVERNKTIRNLQTTIETLTPLASTSKDAQVTLDIFVKRLAKLQAEVDAEKAAQNATN